MSETDVNGSWILGEAVIVDPTGLHDGNDLFEMAQLFPRQSREFVQ